MRLALQWTVLAIVFPVVLFAMFSLLLAKRFYDLLFGVPIDRQKWWNWP